MNTNRDGVRVENSKDVLGRDNATKTEKLRQYRQVNSTNIGSFVECTIISSPSLAIGFFSLLFVNSVFTQSVLQLLFIT